MKKQTCRKFTSAFKAKVALDAIRAQYSLAELAKKYEVSAVIISRWKAELLANTAAVFDKPGKSEEPDIDSQELYAQIGQLKVENEF
jgi:transposase